MGERVGYISEDRREIGVLECQKLKLVSCDVFFYDTKHIS